MTTQQQERPRREWRDVKRQAGCLWGCLTEPLVLVILAFGSLFGAYKIGRQAERSRLQQERRQQPPEQ